MTLRAPLILDTDGGVDDAQALLLLLSADVVPEAITTVFGNVALEAATQNILSVLAVAGAKVPVHAGQAAPMVAAPIHAQEIHGEDGLGGAPRPDRIGETSGEDAVGFLITRLRRAAAEGALVDLLAIGPLTNLAVALRLAPDIADGLGRVTVMGGTRLGRGNVTPAAEFNFYADPEAAAVVLRAPLLLTLVPWESCAAHSLSGEVVDGLLSALPDTARSRFTGALARHARETVQRYGHPDHFRFVDPLAAAVAIAPQIVTQAERASLDVLLAEGAGRGMTLVDPTGRLGTPAAELVITADMARLTEMFAASL